MGYQSNYLCKECGNLLYEDVQTKKEYCINKKCPTFLGFEIINNSQPLEEEIQRRINTLKGKLRLFSSDFKEYLYDLRENMFNQIGEGFNIGKFHAINELILISSNVSFFNRTRSTQKFNQVVDEFLEISIKENFLDSLRQEIFMVVRFPNETLVRTFALKYYPVFTEQYENYGLIHFSRKFKAFKYEPLDILEVDRIPFQIGMEMVPFFKQFFRIMIQMKMLMEYNYRLSLIAKRNFTKKDIAGLLSLFFSSQHRKINWNNSYFNNHLDRNEFTEEEKMNFKKFIFGEGKLVPIGLNENNKNIFLPLTSLFFSFYFLGKLSERDIVNECKREASFRFEEEIRNLLKDKGWDVPFDTEIDLIKGSFKYDIIAVSRKEKKVYLIEVKYSDLPQSAFSGKRLKAIKLEDENADYGEISMGKEHQNRFKEFIDNLPKFEERSKINIKGFEIEPLIVMKYTPLLNSLDNIRFLSFEKLNEELN
ncbi:MAG: hypothetical protein WC511_00815 [Candidatus Pacearchaeota archaeon]